jgi:hypothetical protein
VRAVLAALDMAAERRGAATLDRRHDLQLGEAKVKVSDAGPLQEGRAGAGAGVRKPPKEETAGRKGRCFGWARPMGI